MRHTRQACSPLTPCSGGAWRLLQWTEFVYRRPERCADECSSSRGGPCRHRRPVGAAEAGWIRQPRLLSLLHVNVQESPPSMWTFHFGPPTFNFVFGPHFSYISFDFIRLDPPIWINWMSELHFGPSTFNFRIGCMSVNQFGTKLSIFAILSSDFNWE